MGGCVGIEDIVGLLRPTLAVRWAAAFKLLPNILLVSRNSRFKTPLEVTPNEAVMAVSHGRTVPNMVGASLSAFRLLLLLSASSHPSAMSIAHCLQEKHKVTAIGEKHRERERKRHKLYKGNVFHIDNALYMLRIQNVSLISAIIPMEIYNINVGNNCTKIAHGKFSSWQLHYILCVLRYDSN